MSAVLTEGSRPNETLNNVMEVESRGASVIGCSTDKDVGKFLDEAFETPALGMLSPLVANVYCQLSSYYVARSK
jgi:glucosamine--fructose-6-phosphate aminotransferase (isomerizing)